MSLHSYNNSSLKQKLQEKKSVKKKAKEFIVMFMVGASLTCAPLSANDSYHEGSKPPSACERYVNAKKKVEERGSHEGKEELEAARKDLIREGGLSAPLECIKSSKEQFKEKKLPYVGERDKENTWKEILKFIGTLAFIFYVLHVIRDGASH